MIGLDEDVLDHLAVAQFDVIGPAVDQLVNQVSVQIFLFFSDHLHRSRHKLKEILCVRHVVWVFVHVSGDQRGLKEIDCLLLKRGYQGFVAFFRRRLQQFLDRLVQGAARAVIFTFQILAQKVLEFLDLLHFLEAFELELL